MTQRFEKWRKYFGNDLDILFTTLVIEKRHKYVVKNLNILNMAQIWGTRFKYSRNGFTMFEMD